MAATRPGMNGHVVTQSELERGYLYCTRNERLLTGLNVKKFTCIFLGTPIRNRRLSSGRFSPGKAAYREKNIQKGDVLRMTINQTGNLVVERFDVS